MNRIPRNEAKIVLLQARTCARLTGSASIEAEHLLLALASRPGTEAYAILRNAGLDADSVVEALAVEQAASLAAVGVTSLSAPPPSYVPVAHDVGESTRLALTRGAAAAKARKDRRMRSGHLLAAYSRRTSAGCRAPSRTPALTRAGCSPKPMPH